MDFLHDALASGRKFRTLSIEDAYTREMQLKLLLVASTLDPESERIMNFLSENYGVPINAVFFRYFQDGDSEYLTRSWLIDPSEVDENAAKSSGARTQGLWNGKDFYVAFGEDDERNWDDARRLGFISAGGGKRYSRPLGNLFVGARIFAYIPGNGYVGVGTVTGEVQSAYEFTVEKDGSDIPILSAGLNGQYLRQFANDSEMAEYFVPVQWVKTVPNSETFRKPGMYANQNIVTKLRDQTTLSELREHFDLKD